jgi:hypothetical protein
MLNPVRCFCGRKPKTNTETKDGMNFSFSCCCGGSSVAVFVRSDNQLQALHLWSLLVTNRLNQSKRTEKPTDLVETSVEENTGVIGGGFISIGAREDSNPFRRHMRERFGAHFFGD